MSVVPVANQASMLQFATAPSAKVTKQWGSFPVMPPPPGGVRPL